MGQVQDIINTFCKYVLLQKQQDFCCSLSSCIALVFAKDTAGAESAVASTSSKPTQRYLLEKVEVTTGEEGEYNVLQVWLNHLMENISIMFQSMWMDQSGIGRPLSSRAPFR